MDRGDSPDNSVASFVTAGGEQQDQLEEDQLEEAQQDEAQQAEGIELEVGGFPEDGGFPEEEVEEEEGEGAQNEENEETLNPEPTPPPNAPPPPANMTPQDIAALAKAMQGGRGGSGPKVPLLEDTQVESWRDFRHIFEAAFVINGWTNQRARRELGAKMCKSARQITINIPLDDGIVDGTNDAGPIKVLLDAYQHKFEPLVNAEYTLALANAAKQTETEDLVQFHGRLKALFDRGYPELVSLAGFDMNTWPVLRNKFTDGLVDQSLADFVRQKSPTTYEAALVAAQEARAAKFRQKAAKSYAYTAPPDPSSKSKAGIHALYSGAAMSPQEELLALHARISAITSPQPGPAQAGGVSTFTGECHFCHEVGHMARNCTKKKLANSYFPQGGESRGGGRGGGRGGARGRGGRGRNGGRGGGREGASTGGGGTQKDKNSFSKKQVHSMVQAIQALGKAKPEADSQIDWDAAYEASTSSSSKN